MKMFANKKLLLVDDNATTRLIFSETLQRVGIEVIQAGTALDALEMLSSGLRIDAVITDHVMPGMYGTQFAKLLGGKYPLLLISSNDLKDTVCDSTEITHFQRKPLTPPELLDCVKRLFTATPL